MFCDDIDRAYPVIRVGHNIAVWREQKTDSHAISAARVVVNVIKPFMRRWRRRNASIYISDVHSTVWVLLMKKKKMKNETKLFASLFKHFFFFIAILTTRVRKQIGVQL